jgi:hypothetical protein
MPKLEEGKWQIVKQGPNIRIVPNMVGWGRCNANFAGRRGKKFYR